MVIQNRSASPGFALNSTTRSRATRRSSAKPRRRSVQWWSLQHRHHGIERAVLERQLLRPALDDRSGAGGTLRDHHRAGLECHHLAVGRLVVAGAGAHVQHGAGVAERVPDGGGDPRVGVARVRVGPADPVVQVGTRARDAERSAHGSISTPGLSAPLGSTRRLGAAQRGGERLRTLAVVPRPVVAADRVVVGDRAAALDHRVRGGPLDLGPLLELGAAARRRQDRVVGRGTVRIDVGEAAGDRAAAAHLAARRSPVARARARGTPGSAPR